MITQSLVSGKHTGISDSSRRLSKITTSKSLHTIFCNNTACKEESLQIARDSALSA